MKTVPILVVMLVLMIIVSMKGNSWAIASHHQRHPLEQGLGSTTLLIYAGVPAAALLAFGAAACSRGEPVFKPPTDQSFQSKAFLQEQRLRKECMRTLLGDAKEAASTHDARPVMPPTGRRSRNNVSDLAPPPCGECTFAWSWPPLSTSSCRKAASLEEQINAQFLPAAR